uniref:Pentatricopeptide repeat-containing protein n=1 Tax=Ananas comosus var. bracteatus TaxID=296719 RepID=A0A6V7NJ16_ANACO|nr:unnamed protein product [Ananas comosus var. bracteatus]
MVLLLARANYNSHSPPAADPALGLLPRCKNPRDFRPLHARLITTGLLRDPSVAARVRSDPFLWNALINSSSSPVRALLTFSLMLSRATVAADAFSFSLALRACSRASSLAVGSQIHSLILKSEHSPNIYLQNALITLYSKCRLCGVARQVFDRIPVRDSVSWNSMIDGYIKNGDMDAAESLFDRLGDADRNSVTWNTMIGGYASSVDGIDAARALFDRTPVRDLVSWNLMIDGYVKCGRLADAECLFQQMPKRDVISWANMINGYMDAGIIGMARMLFDEMTGRDVIVWNVMICGYVNNGKFVEALHLFNEMRAECDVSPDNVTLAAALSAVSELGRLCDGIAIHDYIKRNHLSLEGKLGVALIDIQLSSTSDDPILSPPVSEPIANKNIKSFDLSQVPSNNNYPVDDQAYFVFCYPLCLRKPKQFMIILSFFVVVREATVIPEWCDAMTIVLKAFATYLYMGYCSTAT